MYDGIASARRRGVVAAGAACAGDVFLQQHLCNDSSQSKTCLLVILAVFNRRHKQSLYSLVPAANTAVATMDISIVWDSSPNTAHACPATVVVTQVAAQLTS